RSYLENTLVPRVQSIRLPWRNVRRGERRVPNPAGALSSPENKKSAQFPRRPYFMRRVGLLTFLLLCLPVAIWANSSNLVFQNSGGKITVGAGSSLQLSNSTLTSFTGFHGSVINGTLGTVSFKTGVMSVGSLGTSGTFLGGGSFTISGNGSN